MRSLLYGCLITGMFMLCICGCSGSSSPLTPDNPDCTSPHSASVDAALDGVEILNTGLVSVKLDGNELLPWGFRDVMLAREGIYPIEIGLDDPSGEIVLDIDGAELLVHGSPVDIYSGPADGELFITDPAERIYIHLEIPGEHPQTRDITVRTSPSVHLPISPRLGTVQYTEPETGLNIDIAERELLVGVHSGTSHEAFEALAGVLGCEILLEIPQIDVYRVRIPSGESYDRCIRLFATSAIVKFAEINVILYPDIVPNDTYESQEYGNGLMQLYDAWDITTGTNDTIICVVDTGVMRDHPDLYENVIDGEDFISPIGDGLGGETPGDGADNNGDGVPDQNVGHGTHCAGIIGAVGNNSEGVSGHSWQTKILPCRVFPIDGDSGASDSAVAQAIIYGADHGAIGISMSLGSPYGSGTQQSAINYAWGEGSIIVAAAGNSNSSSNHYPSSFPNVISVAATDYNDKKASFSNYGSTVDCSAPGVLIASSYFYEHGGDPWSVPENQRYVLMSGTSMACPQVSGLVALAGSYYPAYTNQELSDQVIFTTDNIDTINPGYIGKLGTGRINDYSALTKPLSADFEIVKLWNDDDNPLYSQGNRDGFLNPGEIIEFQPTVRNTGTKSASNCHMSILGGNGDIELLFESVDLGFVDCNETETPPDPLIFRINPLIDEDTDIELTLRFEYDGGDPIDIPYNITVRTDLGVVDVVTCDGEGLLVDEVPKGKNDIAALAFTIEGDANYATLDRLTIHQTGTAPSSSFTDIQLWLDSDDDGVFIPSLDTRIAYRSYDNPGYRGWFDDLNDPLAGFGAGIEYEEFPPVYFDDSGVAEFHECVLPTAPDVPRTVFVVIGILQTATTGDTVQIGILSKDDVTVKHPDQVSPLNFPIQTDEVPIIGTWLDPQQLTQNSVSADVRFSWRAETAICPVTGNVYVVYDSNRSGQFDVYFKRSLDQAATFEDRVKLDSSTSNEFYPDVQVDSSGTIHVVYYSTKIASNNREIYYTRSFDYGENWDEPVRLTNAVRDSRIPKLATGPDDSLNVTWHDDRTTTYDYNIYFMRSNNGGDTWENTVMVCDTYYASEEVAIVVGGDGVIHVTWEEFSNYYYANVYYSRSTDNGLSFSSPEKITTGSYSSHGWHSDVAADNNGNVYIVFHYVPLTIAAEVSARISNNSGESWNSTFDMTDNYVPDSRPCVSVRPDGSFVDVTFRTLEVGTWNIKHTYSQEGLSTWEDPVAISKSEGGDAREAVVVRGENLNIYAFWEDIVSVKGDYEVFWNRFIY